MRIENRGDLVDGLTVVRCLREDEENRKANPGENCGNNEPAEFCAAMGSAGEKNPEDREQIEK